MQVQAISEKNYAIVAAATAANGCNCVPYEEVKTYMGWQRAGQQVQKGQHSYVRTFKPHYYEEVDPETGATRTKSKGACCVLFCICQTKPIEEEADDAIDEEATTQVAAPV